MGREMFLVKKQRTTKTKMADLQFPVGRILRQLKKGHYAKRVGVMAAVYLGAVLEYMATEVLEQAGVAAKQNKSKRIKPRHLQLAIRNDDELDQVLEGVTIAKGGVIPHIEGILLPRRKK